MAFTEEETLDECIEETNLHPKAREGLKGAESILTTQIRIIDGCPIMDKPTTLIRARASIRQVLDADEKSLDSDE